MRNDNQDWLPMSSAPKDGTVILVVPDGIFDRASFRDGYWFWSTADGARIAAGMDPKGWMPVPLEQVAMLVFCHNAAGAPDVYSTQVQCTRERIDAGDHYDLAFDAARAAGYEPVLAADERDPAYRAFIASRQAEGVAQHSGGDKPGTRYVCEVEVKDALTGLAQTLEVHVDDASGAMFAVDATYLDQISERAVSPYSGNALLFAEPPEGSQPKNLQVALARRDVQAMEEELRASRLELVECYRWASAQSDSFKECGQASPMEADRLGRLKARAESVEGVLERLAARQDEPDAPHGQIVSVSGDAGDPEQEVVVEVYAFVDGGVVQGVTANVPVKVTVIDYDVGDGDCAVEVEQGDGRTAPAVVGHASVKVDPARCQVLADLAMAEGRTHGMRERGERG